MFYIAEVTHRTKRIVTAVETFKQAEHEAINHNFRSGVTIEILDERCKIIKTIMQYSEC